MAIGGEKFPNPPFALLDGMSKPQEQAKELYIIPLLWQAPFNEC